MIIRLKRHQLLCALLLIPGLFTWENCKAHGGGDLHGLRGGFRGGGDYYPGAGYYHGGGYFHGGGMYSRTNPYYGKHWSNRPRTWMIPEGVLFDGAYWGPPIPYCETFKDCHPNGDCDKYEVCD
jgi:hypothetical protein